MMNPLFEGGFSIEFHANTAMNHEEREEVCTVFIQKIINTEKFSILPIDNDLEENNMRNLIVDFILSELISLKKFININICRYFIRKFP